MLTAQENLVPNHSFEDYFRCPDISGNNSKGLGSFVYNWENAFINQTFNNGGAYYHACDKRNEVSVPINYLGFQYAATGNAYACLWQARNNASRNYWGVSFTRSMQKGKLYHVSFKINPADSTPFFMNKFGINFYTQPTVINPGPEMYINYGAKAVYPNKAHIYSDKVLDYVTQWYTIQGDFKADSNYTYLVIGNFFSIDSITSVRHFYGESERLFGTKNSFYFIDDVEVYQIKQLKAEKEKICKGDSTYLYTYKVDGAVYWKQDRVSTDTLSNADTLVVKPEQTTTYYLFSASNELIDSVTIEVFQLPEHRILPSDTVLCRTSELLLNAQYDGAAYKWSTGDTTAFIKVSGKGRYSARIGLPECFVEEEVQVTVCPTTLFVPNAFTPNGDGVNDVFKPVGLRVTDYHFQVYDKWGKVSFETNTFEEGWTGTEFPADVYYYWITYTDSDGRSQSQKGTVQLLR